MISFVALMMGCKDKENVLEIVESETTIVERTQEITLHPAPENSFVGDPMPYFDGKEMNIFFLDDQRIGGQGYHPWARYRTTDFCSYEFDGVVIPFGSDIKKQDIAIGTGSVIKDENGVYHAFYTGHNDTYSPKEAIMHAISRDLQTWEKQENDTFYADEEYSSDDFRDPYVFYNEQDEMYWMLITTRKDNMGVIALYKSTDLIHWKNEKVLFENDMGSDSNLECPMLIEWNGYWYLTFSDQWPDRIVHYRISKSPEGPFEKPVIDYFDGNGFYAGRLEKMDGNMYLIGWNATKEGHQDEKNYIWGGNLVSHQIIQVENGILKIAPIQTVIDAMIYEKNSEATYYTETVQKEESAMVFSGTDYEIVTYPKLEGNTKITGKIIVKEDTDIFGFAFNLGDSKFGSLNYVFNIPEGVIGFYNKRTDTVQSEEAQSEVDYIFHSGDEIEFTILFGETVATLYVNNEIALTARMYSANRREWGFFSKNSNIILQNIEIYN